ncbi:hypothetical protein PTSG_01014 [Salpingoeca rosetta]|uniref:Uncharacterized protein n=1 Tax=Salpingoeca rosetta (strain ATCC 50818 / BSB-021) TaxID=946362 RepID=F2TY52_SALR5|nr:uncharacterized protein PTSG_01014 [Salpingoeca rosetta]EGD76311.1 hypothetical protein PTSG_01014 [Salpingoeca rosetta]|eukprot:XP_004998486.1 hypothetical protein PTSG_01014 [Salpingoeca rosetta]
MSTTATAAVAMAMATARRVHVAKGFVARAVACVGATPARAQLHTCSCMHTKYPPRDPQYDFKMYTLRPAAKAQASDFIHELGLTNNGVIGSRLTIEAVDQYSRMGSNNAQVPLPASTPRSKNTQHSFLLLDEDKVPHFMKNATEYVFPDLEGLDKEYDMPESEVISRDPACANRRFSFVFVDTSEGQTHNTRHIRIREQDGTLRTATREEHERYNQEFFAEPSKRAQRPAVCREESLPGMFAMNRHKYILDLTVKHLHPYQRDYREVHEAVYKDVVVTSKFNALQDSPHWPAFVRWLVRTDQAHVLISTLMKASRFKDAAKLVHFIKTGSIAIPDSIEENKKIAQDYLQEFKPLKGNKNKQQQQRKA